MLSRISQKDIRPDQYLAEIAIIRQAQKRGIVLTREFWKEDLWKTEFKAQLLGALSLLKVFSVEVILTVLNREIWINTLRNRKLIEYCKQELDRLNRLPKSEIKEYSDTSTAVPTVKKKSNLFDSIKDIENA